MKINSKFEFEILNTFKKAHSKCYEQVLNFEHFDMLRISYLGLSISLGMFA
jgi:hypothetical protein